MNYQIKSAIFITLAYKNSYDIHSNPNQKTLFVALILLSISKKHVKCLQAALYSKSATFCKSYNFWMQAAFGSQTAICTPLV